MDPDNREASALLARLPRAAQSAQPKQQPRQEAGEPQAEKPQAEKKEAEKAPLREEAPAANVKSPAETHAPQAIQEELPPPPSPPTDDEASLRDERRDFVSSQRLKEARLAISEGDAAKAEERLLEALRIGPNREATELLNRLRSRAAPSARQMMPPPPPPSP